MLYTVNFNRQRRRAERELQKERSEKLRRKPSVTFQPEDIIINGNDSEVAVKPQVQKLACILPWSVCTQSSDCLWFI